MTKGMDRALRRSPHVQTQTFSCGFGKKTVLLHFANSRCQIPALLDLIQSFRLLE